MFQRASWIAPKEGFSRLIEAYVRGRSCMIPVPLLLTALGFRPDSTTPCALNQRQSKPGPK